MLTIADYNFPLNHGSTIIDKRWLVIFYSYMRTLKSQQDKQVQIYKIVLTLSIIEFESWAGKNKYKQDKVNNADSVFIFLIADIYIFDKYGNFCTSKYILEVTRASIS